jgi:hypothetical protein
VTWIALGGAALLQLVAGIVRVRAWFHVIRHSCPDASSLRYRDVVLAHLGGVGWNAVLPARAGDAVKVVIVNRRMPERRLALLASTLAPPGLVEAAFTGLLVAGLVMTNLLSPMALTSLVRPAGLGFAIAGAVAVAVVGAVLCRHHLRRFARSVRAGLAVLAHPRVMATRVVPWLAAARGIRLLAFALVLPAAGVPLRLEPALALMALQGATPSAGAAATAARIALLAALFSGAPSADVAPEDVAGALAAAYGLTSAVNLAVSVVAIAWLLGTTSPRRIARYVRSSLRRVPPEPRVSSADVVP